MSTGLVYTDHTTLSSGKYKFYKLHEVPAEYLLNIFSNLTGCVDKSLAEYAEKNIDRIKAKADGFPFIVEAQVEVERCTKIQYMSKKVAREALQKIRDAPGDHKKPIRSYECEKCSAWHLTSVPIEVWKENQQMHK
jgi:capsule polysaccharide modification protein KpsS